jgi:hypothetical protein
MKMYVCVLDGVLHELKRRKRSCSSLCRGTARERNRLEMWFLLKAKILPQNELVIDPIFAISV